MCFDCSTRGSQSEERTLCRGMEEVYFSCKANGKLLSVCAVGNVTPWHGRVEFRYGDYDSDVESTFDLHYPKIGSLSRGKFSIDTIVEDGEIIVRIKFKSQEFDFVLSQAINSELLIFQNGKYVRTIRCEPGGDYATISSRAFKGLPRNFLTKEEESWREFLK